MSNRPPEAQLVKTIEHIRRLTNSPAGNPAFEIIFTDGTHARTASDAACAYDVGNPGMREGSRVAVQYARRGEIAYLTAL